VRPLQILAQNLFISANRFVQRAGIAALEQGAASVREMRDAYARRRDRMVAGLRALGFGVPHVPDGAFYCFVDAKPLMERFGRDDSKLAMHLLEHGVAVVAASAFGGKNGFRVSFAADEAVLEEAMRRIAKALA